VAVHKTFAVLDTVPHILTTARITDPTVIHIVRPNDILNPDWFVPGIAGSGQQAFGDALLQKYPFVLIPSTVSQNSWNIIFDHALAKDSYDGVSQELFALDTRLNPSRRPSW
jgi:RES domain-containing protein